MMPQEVAVATENAEEERILRLWTPLILRTILVSATLIIIGGLIVMGLQRPDYYVDHFHQVQQHGIHATGRNFSRLWVNATHGDPQAILTIGLMVLTLVPLARVAFCFLLFAKEGDRIYVVLTAYVLTGLIVGVVLGRVG
jgi:uncharacterized membrane protein